MWRTTMVQGLALPPPSRVVDVAAGTGSISRALQAGGHHVVPVDLCAEMVAGLKGTSLPPVVAAGDRLPFRDEAFDGLTFGYLLRYVDDVTACMSELARVVRPGGRVGMVEFGRPVAAWGLMWKAYTRAVLPAAGALIGSGWRRVGTFLGPSIEEFADRWPPTRLAGAWEAAGFVDVEVRILSVGGGVVMWGTKA